MTFSARLLLYAAASFTACGGFDHRDEKRLSNENNDLRNSLAQEEQAKEEADANASAATAALVSAKNDAARLQKDAAASRTAKAAADAALVAARGDKDAALIEKADLEKKVATLTAQLVDGQKRADAASAEMAHFRSRLKAALPDHPELAGDDWTDSVIASLDRLVATADLDALNKLRIGLKAALSLPADASDDAIVGKINDLKATVDQEKATLTALQRQLDEKSKELAEVTTKLGEDITSALAPFMGIWVADGLDSAALPPGCRLLVRVSAGPSQLIRAIICPNGNLETSAFTVANLVTEGSPFPGGLQFTTQLTAGSASCSTAQTSTVGAQGGLSFDLKTATGAESATYAYSSLGGRPMSFRNGGGFEELRRTKDCSKIIDMAASPNADPLLPMAAKVCNVEKQVVGCFTAAGFVARSTP